MRPSPAIVLLILITGCSVADVSLAPSGSRPPSQPAAASASVQPGEPDWSAFPDLGIELETRGSLSNEWSALMGAAPLAHGGLWVSNGGEMGEPPLLRRLDPETIDVTAVVELGGESDVAPPNAYGAMPSAHGIWVPMGYEKEVVLVDAATASVARRIEVDANPYGLVEDGDSLWIADFANSEVLRIDIPSGEEQLRVAIPDPTWMVAGPEGVWVIEHGTGHVTRLDPETGATLARVEVGGRPCLALGLGSVWSGSQDDGTVARIDPATNEVVATIQLPSNGCGGAVADGSIWVAVSPYRGSCERTSYLVRIDPQANEIAGLASISCVAIVAVDGPHLWLVTGVEGDPREISVVDTRQAR